MCRGRNRDPRGASKLRKGHPATSSAPNKGDGSTPEASARIVAILRLSKNPTDGRFRWGYFRSVTLSLGIDIRVKRGK
jgi:hypothetical protein